MENSKIAVFTDSGCDLSDAILAKHGIDMISLRITFSDGEFRDRKEITPGEVYARLKHEMPKTSLPHSQDVLELMDKYKQQGATDAIFVSVSSGLSGTRDFISLLTRGRETPRVHVFDSRGLSLVEGYLALEAKRMADDDCSVQDILDRLLELRESTFGMFVVRSLEYLVKGGRIGRVEGRMGALLDIKPLISLDDNGVYYSVDKARGFKRALAKMVRHATDACGAKTVQVAVIHGDAAEEAQTLAQELKKLLRIDKLIIAPCSPVLGAHSGPGLLGIVAYAK